MQIEKYISSLVAYQFPSFYREEGQDFIEFVKAYYEWMEQEGNVINVSRSLLDYNDLDTTLDSFIIYFKNKFINSLPENVVADKNLLIKHIADLYNAKGTERGYKLLFRLLFNEDIDIYVPGKFVIKSSDAEWVVPSYIEVTDSPYLPMLVGNKIYSSGGATAVVESTFKKIVKAKTTHILYLSSINGEFKNGEQILSLEVPEITKDNAPRIFGSLSIISVTSGGTNFNIGDLLSVEGQGESGRARVVSTTNQNGKVTLQLLNGGFGFSVNATITITGGGGTGASAKVGGITNKQTYVVSTDIIDTFKDTVLEYSTQTMEIGVSGISGTFSANDKVTSSANVTHFDVRYLSGEISTGESLSNSSMGISGLVVYKPDRNILYVTGPDTSLTNANLIPGVILTSNSSSSLVEVKATFPKVTVTSNGQVNAAASNASVITVFNATSNIGYFIPGSTLTDANTSATATITSVTRKTDWGGLPAAVTIVNLDTQISEAINVKIMEVGTIAYLKDVNPGIGYSSDPTVVAREPDIYNMKISDGLGGFWGGDATIIATAGVASGVVTAVKVVDSGFNYNPDESLVLTSLENPTSVFGTAIVETHGIGSGYSKTNVGFLSDEQFLQDSYYYQPFSYEIVAPRMIESYKKLLEDLIHPTGIALFGRYTFKSELTNENSQPVYFDWS